ncbi:CdaR family transcriptional regulator [Streptomyces griseus]|uniref:PucR family transcriptional regulator n=1 Tax=Streptomyces griseus TaxID=1911 RepID=UPI000A5C79CA|nr:helix-turn-helix domain-containing protein [Streptomyces griseus]
MPAALDRAPDTGAPTGELLDRALAPLGAPACHLLTGSGRTVARTAAARAEIPAPRAADLLRTGRGTTLRVDDGAATDFDAWHLYLPEPVRVPARALAEVAALLARHRRERDPDRTAERATAELADALHAFDTSTDEHADRVRTFGSPGGEDAYGPRAFGPPGREDTGDPHAPGTSGGEAEGSVRGDGPSGGERADGPRVLGSSGGERADGPRVWGSSGGERADGPRVWGSSGGERVDGPRVLGSSGGERVDGPRAWGSSTAEPADPPRASGLSVEERGGLAGEFGLAGGGPDPARLRAALAGCGLGDTGPYTVVAASLAPRGAAGDAAAALAEALRHLPSAARAVTEGPDGGATAVVAPDPDAGYDVRARLGEVWPLIHGCRPEAAPHAGVSGPVDAPERLPAGLAQARYALAAARVAGPAGPRVVGLGDLDGLDMLLAGVPADVREVYRDTVLGPLRKAGRGSAPMLLETLESFLAHDRSWARTAEALHVHVNTVHYRVSRIEELTGRDLSRLDHAADLRAALLCR